MEKNVEEILSELFDKNLVDDTRPRLAIGMEQRKGYFVDKVDGDYFIQNANPKDIHVKVIKIRTKFVGRILGQVFFEETHSDGDFILQPGGYHSGRYLSRKLVGRELTLIAEYDGEEYKISGKMLPRRIHESLNLIIKL